jgi:hypothetical protein
MWFDGMMLLCQIMFRALQSKALPRCLGAGVSVLVHSGLCFPFIFLLFSVCLPCAVLFVLSLLACFFSLVVQVADLLFPLLSFCVLFSFPVLSCFISTCALVFPFRHVAIASPPLPYKTPDTNRYWVSCSSVAGVQQSGCKLRLATSVVASLMGRFD